MIWRILVVLGSLMAAAPVAVQAAAQTALPAGLHPVLVQYPGNDSPELIGAWQSGAGQSGAGQSGSGQAGRWLGVAETIPQLGVSGVLQRRSLTGAPVAVQGGRAVSVGEPCQFSFTVPVTPQVGSAGFLLFTSGIFNVRPRPVVALPTTNAAYREIVRQELVRRGIKTPNVRLLGVTRADLDGNGTDEVIIEAASFANRDGLFPPPVGDPGDYSLLLLRHLQGGQVVTTVLGEHIAPLTPWNPDRDDAMPMASLFRLAGIADLNGDGRMELVSYGAYYEGRGLSVSEWAAGRERSTPLEGGCGV